MTTSQTEVESQAVIELSKKSLDTFCDEISTLLAADIECNQQTPTAETVAGLKKHFPKLAALYSIKAEGTLDETFQLVFDQDGIFILAGLTLMQSEQMILEDIKQGSPEKARDMNDVLTEVGHTLVGAWDRVFREGLAGHSRFLQTSVFIGNLWEESEDAMGPAGDEEFVFVPYEMKISSYRPFNCGVIFPKKIFSETSGPDSDPSEPVEKETQDQKATSQKATSQKAEPEEPDTTQKSDKEKAKLQKPVIEKPATKQATTEGDSQEASAAEKKPDTEEKPKPTKKNVKRNKPKVEVAQKSDDTDAAVSDNVVKEKTKTTTDTDKSEEQAVSESIQEMTQSPAILPGEPSSSTTAKNPSTDSISEILAISAKDVMQKDLLWGSQDDSVQQALTKLQQHDASPVKDPKGKGSNGAGYMVIGSDGTLEGIVSKSDLTAVLSPYLRPAFTKWRRPLDDATLQIKIKWVMSSSVHTVMPETSLATIIENMCTSGVRCLPVVDAHAKVQGLVTVFDVFKALLKHNSDASAASGGTQ